MKTLAGNLLIAVPGLEDSNFFRSVVLVLHHDQFGASGVVLNRPTDVTARQAWTDQDDLVDVGDVCETALIQIGGPVEGPLIVLHQDRDLAEESIVPGVFMSTQRNAVERLVRLRNCPRRLFAGYSGWGTDQLANEISQGAWMTTAADESHVFGDLGTLWNRACESFGTQVIASPSDGRSNPGLN